MRTKLFILALSFSSVLSFSASGQAQSAAEIPPHQEARASYSAGATAYAEGRYSEALALFQRSYELSGRAALLFNIGQCHDRLRNEPEAIIALRSYLNEYPNAENQAAVEERIRILDARVSETNAQSARLTDAEMRAREAEEGQGRAERRQEAQERELARQLLQRDDQATPITRKWWFWTLVGVAVVGASVAIIAATYDPGVADPTPGDGGHLITALGSWR